MKAIISTLALTTVFAIQLYAGPQEIIKEKAKNLRDQNNAQQGVPTAPAQRSAPPAASTAKPAPIKATPAAKIKTNLAGWQAMKTISAESKKEFAADVLSAARGSKRPTGGTVEKFTDSLAVALGGKSLGGSELSRLASNINLAVNSAGLSQERTDEVAAQVQADLESAGATTASAAEAAKDLRAVMDELSL